MKLTIFGTGYVGLVSGACFAEMGNDVLCMDVNTEKVDQLKHGHLPLFEPGLTNLVSKNIKRNHLKFTANADEAVRHGDILFIAVGTPADEDGSADLKHVLSVAHKVGRQMHEPKIIVNKSTVPVGTADKVRQAINEELKKRQKSTEFYVASNPEFLKEGDAVNDFMKPDRIIIGSDSTHCAQQLQRLYTPFNRNHEKVIHMDLRSAELTKYAANMMLATRISLMNELANLSDRLGADIEAVRLGIGKDPRIGFHFIYPGVGYGGSCFPKDVKALIRSAATVDYDATIAKGVEAVNTKQKRILFDRCLQHYNGDISGRTFAIWGLAFKPNTSDMREAPSLSIINLLLAAGARIRAYDPEATQEAQSHYDYSSEVVIVANKEDAITDADGLFVLTEWNEFRSPDFKTIKSQLRKPVLFDGRNLYDPEQLVELGFSHYPIGRGANQISALSANGLYENTSLDGQTTETEPNNFAHESG